MGSCLSSVLESPPPPLRPLNAGPGGGGGLLPASPPVRLSLPPDAVRETVRSVYDGDTLTLNGRGGKKVRLLGIDTPEIAERQPFAKEAGEYTRNICGSGEEIWLEFSGKEEDGQEGEGDREDRYGRLLAFVWVPASRGGGGTERRRCRRREEIRRRRFRVRQRGSRGVGAGDGLRPSAGQVEEAGQSRPADQASEGGAGRRDRNMGRVGGLRCREDPLRIGVPQEAVQASVQVDTSRRYHGERRFEQRAQPLSNLSRR